MYIYIHIYKHIYIYIYEKDQIFFTPKLAKLQRKSSMSTEQGYLAHKKTPNPQRTPYGPRHGPTVGFYGVAFSLERGTPPVGRPEEGITTGVPRS